MLEKYSDSLDYSDDQVRERWERFAALVRRDWGSFPQVYTEVHHMDGECPHVHLVPAPYNSIRGYRDHLSPSDGASPHTSIWYLRLSPHMILAALAKAYERGNDATLYITIPSDLDRALAQEVVSHIIDSAPPVVYDLVWRDRRENSTDKPVLLVYVEHPTRDLGDSE